MKNKKMIIMIVLLLLTLSFGGCGKEKPEGQESSIAAISITEKPEEQESTIAAISITEKPEATITEAPETVEVSDTKNEYGEYIPSEVHVKTLGRTYFDNRVLWLSFSATGAEFTFNASQCEITLEGDASAEGIWGAGHEARVAVYLNDELVADILMNEKLKTIPVYRGEIMEGTVRIVKLSESADSSVGIRGVKTDGAAIQPTKEKELKIEFIGDSITCGYGVDGVLGDKYLTANENAIKSYAYKTSKKLDADYSMVSFSGYGIISGYTSSGKINTAGLLPQYYDKFGKNNWAIPNLGLPVGVTWNFDRFVPDIVVINLGTNDSSYCGTDVEKSKVFSNGYVEFLKTVRENNSEAYIVCTLGIMGDTLYPYVEKAVKQYQEETGDLRISSMKFEVQQAADGIGVDWHPSEATHEKAALKLTEYIKTLKFGGQE